MTTRRRRPSFTYLVRFVWGGNNVKTLFVEAIDMFQAQDRAIYCFRHEVLDHPNVTFWVEDVKRVRRVTAEP